MDGIWSSFGGMFGWVDLTKWYILIPTLLVSGTVLMLLAAAVLWLWIWFRKGALGARIAYEMYGRQGDETLADWDFDDFPGMIGRRCEITGAVVEAVEAEREMADAR